MVTVTESASEVRSAFADFLDEARVRPKYIGRRKYEYVVLSADVLDSIIGTPLDVKLLKDDDGGYFTESKALPDCIGFGSSREDAMRSFSEAAVSFSYEYYDKFPLYSAAPGRAGQAPVILRVISHFEQHGSIERLLKVS